MTLGKAAPSSQWGSGLPLWHNPYWRQRWLFWRAHDQCVCVCWRAGKTSSDRLTCLYQSIHMKFCSSRLFILKWYQLVFCSSVFVTDVCYMACQVDRSPTGSGVTARIALQYHKGLIALNQTRSFQSGATGSVFTGTAVEVPVAIKTDFYIC